MLGSYPDVVRHRAPFVLLAQTFFFAFFFFWRCGGMMLLGMALYKSGFLDGRRPAGDLRARRRDLHAPRPRRSPGTARPSSSASAYAMPQRAICRPVELRRRGVRVGRLCRGLILWS